LDAYIFLLTTRFGENLRIERTLNEDCRMRRLPPAVSQMLIENAIKHNVIARNRPLTIQIFLEADCYLVIRNTLQRKSSVEPSSRIGLENIRRRYHYLTSQQVIIEETPETFTVKIPLL